ncbi:MAG: DUF6259 domain-containing protein [Planctomycetota bacterium]
MKRDTISVTTSRYALALDNKTGSLVSFASREPQQEFLHPLCGHRPLFRIRLREETGGATHVSALQAATTCCIRQEDENETNLRLDFKRLAGQLISAHVQIRCPKDEALTYWTIDVENHTGQLLEWIDFPCVIVPTRLSDKAGSERLLWSRSNGALFDIGNRPLPESLRRDNIPSLTSETGRETCYPGIVAAQLMAYYNDKAGLYCAAHDGDGRVKIIAPFQVGEAVRLTFVHFRGSEGERDALSYPVVLGVFEGDWYAAAEIYRQWAHAQQWCKTPLPGDRSSWRPDSPIVTTFLLRTHYDCQESPSANPDYMPLSNSLPHLDRLASQLESPLAPLLYCWEKNAPWTAPDAYPPLGGEEEFRRFFDAIAKRGWHGGVCANGTRWVTAHHKAGYDGSAFFRDNHGEEIVCRHENGEPWVERWDSEWRTSMPCCAGQPLTTEMVLRQVKLLIEYGCDFLYFYDQNGGGESFACYAKNHKHPAYPGIWQTDKMRDLLGATRTLCAESGREIILLPEGPVAEPFIPYYDAAEDVNHTLFELGGEPIPLYNFLYHGYIQKFDSNLTMINDPDALLLKTALACVRGDGFQIVLREKGRINRGHQVMWERTLLDQKSCITLMRRANKLRRGKGGKYLILGQMQRPATIGNVPERVFTNEGWTHDLLKGAPVAARIHRYPSVLCSAWRSPDGSLAYVLVNYGHVPQEPIIPLEGEGPFIARTTMVEVGEAFTREGTLPCNLSIPMPSLSVALVELLAS